MNKYLITLCSILLGVFASCSQSEIGDETPQSNQVTLKVTADEGLSTRTAASGVNRFAIEVYTDASYTTAANVFGGTNKATTADGVFTMVLDRTQTYYCLLWADKDGLSVYTITDLKAVTLTGNAVEAWQGKAEIAAGANASLTATIKRAVSKITLLETGQLNASSTLKLKFSQPTQFNVSDGTTSTTSARTEELISITSEVDGTAQAAKLNTADIFVLSSVSTADLTDLTFQFNSEEAFEVSKAPLRANFNTNIKGHYSTAIAEGKTFTATCDDTWESSNNDKDLK